MPLTRTCPLSGTPFIITDEDLAFYEKMGVPPPMLCPEERQRQRIAYRNFRNLYQRKCDGTGKSIISMYHPDQPFPVYDNEYWWSDHWDALKYGQDFDFSRPFFEQYREFSMKIPRFATMNLQSENCKYSNFSWLSKDCYLVFGCVRSEDCLYGHIVWDSRDCFDSLYLFESEQCLECIDCAYCHALLFSTECSNCSDSFFLHDCRGCRNCFGCFNLRNKEFHFFNEKLTSEAYEAKIKSITPFSRETIEMGKHWLEKAKKERAIFPEKFALKEEFCSGNHIYESKNCQDAYDTKRSEDSRYLYTTYEQINSQDISFTGGRTQNSYQCITMFNSESCMACHVVNNSSNALYSEFCNNCTDIFGCHGLRRGQHLIMNKSFTQHEYEVLTKKIKNHMKETGEWGKFFPMKDSPFAYNESIVQEYYSLNQDSCISQGLKWREEEKISHYQGAAYTLPKNRDSIPDDICDKILTCEVTGKHYKIQKSEKIFHETMKIPLPSFHPNERHKRRMLLRNPRHLYARTCADCHKEIQTTYSHDRPEKILCEECYLKVLN